MPFERGEILFSKGFLFYLHSQTISKSQILIYSNQRGSGGFDRIDPKLLLEKVLGLTVEYQHLSYDGSILGMTSFTELKLLHGFYNMDTNSVELTYSDGSVLTIDCEEVENFYNVTNSQMADLDWLVYHAPMEYAGLVVSEELERHLKGTVLHGMED